MNLGQIPRHFKELLLCLSLVLPSVFGPQAYAEPFSENTHEADVVLIGAGIMSATLATLLLELDPQLKIEVYERLDTVAGESSDTMNNAGTGHAALCELNYTPELADGTIDISKAVHINEEFEISKQFWAYLTERGRLGQPRAFIHTTPHLSWVKGEANVQFLRRRFAALKPVHLFSDMEYSENIETLREWMPLIMQGRISREPMAATRSFMGTDIDFGQLTEQLFQNFLAKSTGQIYLSHEVRSLSQEADGHWQLKVKSLKSGEIKNIRAGFVFIGAGGGSLSLLQKSGVKEARGYGGFPVRGEFLLYKGSTLADVGFGKVYGQATAGAPPMSVPHLDTRIIGGQNRLIFGPFAGATTRFLKKGSAWDFFRSLRMNNLGVMFKAGWQNLSLVKYLADQEMQSDEDRLQALREFIPNARAEDWELVTAGQRVQVIKQSSDHDSVLQFGTEVVISGDGRLAALLGASPGASTSVSAMLEVLERSFATRFNGEAWQDKLREMIPSLGRNLAADDALATSVRTRSARALGLKTDNNCVEALTTTDRESVK